MAMKTRFQYKSPMTQVYEWRDAYYAEYGRDPAVIEMSRTGWDAVVKYFTSAGLSYAFDKTWVSGQAPQICGMQVVIKEHDHDQG